MTLMGVRCTRAVGFSSGNVNDSEGSATRFGEGFIGAADGVDLANGNFVSWMRVDEINGASD